MSRGDEKESAVIRAAEDTLAFEDFILDSIADRRQTPVDDFLGRLIAPPNEDEALSDAEIVNMCSQVLVGGNESTTNLLSNMIHRIATTPGLQDVLHGTPDRVPSFVEEELRIDPPLQAMYRITLHQEDFGGTKIPPGSKLMLNFGSANRDETYYRRGEEFDLDRDNSETLHLSFGRGIHACAGQAFARREAVIAVQKLVARLPSLRLSAAMRPEQARLFGVRGYQTLPIEFEPTPRRPTKGG